MAIFSRSSSRGRFGAAAACDDSEGERVDLFRNVSNGIMSGLFVMKLAGLPHHVSPTARVSRFGLRGCATAIGQEVS
jgi:hypothetical protein